MTTALSPAATGAVAALALAAAMSVYLLLSPGPVRLSRTRRRPGTEGTNALTGIANAATGAVEKILRRRGVRVGALERAGLKMRPQDLVFLVLVGAVAAGAIGLALAGPWLAVVLALLAPVGAKAYLGILAARRQRAFADQLADSLQLLASTLRAGHSLPQALASVAREAEEPTSEEFARVINETRVGHDLTEVLEETADRMGSQDFVWVTQAIAINREVGGNLAEVLDGVGHTIRERHQIRRQVKALSAEGKLSAYILMALPFGVVGFLSLSNPQYLAKFTQGVIGYGLMGLSVVLLVVGGFWLSKTVKIKF
ncbi:type II secretion system F family protein [Georgenia yuyongxinii]|uniref:Type II secretion system protein F n=1 Tax=Georgenia yuyongxinii TaxID=2589797 RepID=A0A552WQG4_9MICO|nr:type II secretion system F family protein [Georgenia yuyongxinii]TRW44934.1 type II secretion system protein F [Georgenia yuyongxinii]